jgi:UDP-glucose:(heptosyl)LPS alpha-1,3-glucosyltransferase
MRIAFGIVSLFAGGGLQRDCLQIARLVRDQGHEVVIHTSRVLDPDPKIDLPLVLLQNGALTNHARDYKFAEDFLKESTGRYNLIVGFGKLLDVDVLYCADPCVAYRVMKQPYLRLLLRYRTYLAIEQNSFAPLQRQKILLLSENQRTEFQSAWQTEPSRISILPPTINEARRQPECRTSAVRQSLRSQLGFGQQDWVWMCVGVQPTTKGLDRAVEALAHFGNARLLIAGLSETSPNAAKIIRRARRLGISSRINWLGHREDIPQLMAAADLLVHPARYDTTGTVILEAIVNGLPVVATAACGYASHVTAAGAGIVVAQPFKFSAFLAAMRRANDVTLSQAWSRAAETYGRDPNLYTGQMRAAEIMLDIAKMKALTPDSV